MADLPDNYNLHYNLGGYLKYELSDNMSGTLVPRGRVGEQAHGISQFIFSSSGTFDLYKFGNSFLSGTNNATVEELEDEEIHTYLNTYVTGSGVLTSGTISNFFADDGEYKLVNIAGRQIVRSTKDYYEIATYDSIFANKLAGVKLQSGTVTISGTLVNIVSSGTAESFDIITMLDQTGSTNVTLQNDNGELTIAGDMDITGDFTVAGTTYLQSVVTEVTDPILLLGAGTSASHTTDRGIEFKYYNGSVKSGFFGYNQDNERFVYLLDATNSSETITGTLGMIDVGGIYVSGSQKNNVWDTAYSWGDHSTAGYADSSHSHSVAHSSLTGITTSDHHTRYTDTEAIDAIESLSLQSATSSDYVIFSGSSGLGKIAFSSLDENTLTGIKTYVDNSVANSDTFAELNDVSVVPNENDFVVYSGSNWVDRTPAQVKDILGLGSTSSPTFDDVTITGTVTLSGDAIINETNVTNDFTFQIAGTDIFSVTSDGIEMAGFPESDYEFKGDLDGGIRFEIQAGEDLSKGDVVYISGALGDNTIVSKAQANSASTMPAFGLMIEDVTNGNAGQVVTFGNLYGSGGAPLDTSTCTVGDVLYVSPTTAGEWTKTKPTGEGNLIQNIGKVIRSASSNGVIKVGGAGRTNDTPNLNDGNIFIGNTSNQITTSTLDTSIVPENTNLYYTDARARSALSASGDLSYDSGTGAFSFTETHLSRAGSYDYLSVSDHTITLEQIDLTTDVTGVLPSANLDADTAHLSGIQTFTGAKTFSADATFTGDIYGRSVDAQYSRLYRMGGIYFTWDSDTYGTNFEHSITSTDNGVFSDDITINSFGHVRINFDSNSNGTNTFSIGHHTTGTANTLFSINESGNITVTGTVDGRDLAADGSKLDGIESGATADQTQADINALAITEVGTITTGTWQGSTIADAYIANDITLGYITQITNRSHTDLSDIGTNTHANIDTHIASTSNPHSVSASDIGLGNVENTALSTWAGSSNLTTLGTITTGTWNGSVIASAYLDSDTAHLSGAQTFTGAKQFNEDVTLYHSDNGTTVNPILILKRDGTQSPQTSGEFGQIKFIAPSLGGGGDNEYAKITQGIAGSWSSNSGWSGKLLFNLKQFNTSTETYLDILELYGGNYNTDPYVKVDADFTVTGDITVNGNVDGVDIAARDHDAVSLVTTSHDYLSLSGQAITLGQIDISDDTNLVAGTNISLSGDTLNVDDAFLINNGDDTTSGKISAGGLISQNKTTTPDEIGDIKIARLHPSAPDTSAIGDIDNLETFILSKTDSGFGTGTNPASNNAFGVISLQTHNGNYFTQLGFDTSNNQLWVRSADNSASWDSWTKVWNAGNDGSGSGLDADLLDGNHASAFALSGHSHAGDIEGVTAGAGLTGGGTTGTVTLDIGAGTGITVNADDIAIGQDVATTADVDFNTVTVVSGIEVSNGGATGTGSIEFGGRNDLGLYASGYDLRLAAPDGIYINLDSNSNDTTSVFSISHDTNTFNPSSNLIADFGESQIRFFKNTEHQDNVYAYFGTDSDASLYHDDTDFHIENTKGHLDIINSGSDIRLQSAGNVTIELDTNQDGNNYFRIVDGNDNTDFIVGENLATFPYAYGIRYYYDVTSNYEFTTAVTDDGIQFSTASNTRDFKFKAGSAANTQLQISDTQVTVGVTDGAVPLAIARYANTGTYDDLGVIQSSAANSGIGINYHNGTAFALGFKLTKTGTVDITASKLTIGGGAGSDGQVLTTDGTGNISWSTVGGTTMNESYTDIGGTGYTAQSSLTVTTAPTDARVYVDGIKMRPNTNSTSWDYDFYRPNTTTIQFTADLPSGSVVAMEWIA